MRPAAAIVNLFALGSVPGAREAELKVFDLWKPRKLSLSAEVLIGIAVAILAILIRAAIEMVVKDVVVFALLFPAVSASTAFAGWRAGLVTFGICQTAAWYFFLPRLNSFAFATPGNAVSLGLTSLILLAMIWFIHRYRTQSALIAALEAERADRLQEALRELDHRTMNNFQLAAGILQIEASDQPLPETRAVLEASAARIAALAIAHRQLGLMQPGDLRRPLKPLLEELLEGLRQMAPPRVTIRSRLDDVNLSHQDALRIGLTVNELVTNALKHAFPDGQGRIDIDVEVRSTDLVLTVADDGVGRAAARRDGSAGRQGSGQKIVAATLKALGAEREEAKGPGTRVRIRIPLPG